MSICIQNNNVTSTLHITLTCGQQCLQCNKTTNSYCSFKSWNIEIVKVILNSIVNIWLLQYLQLMCGVQCHIKLVWVSARWLGVCLFQLPTLQKSLYWFAQDLPYVYELWNEWCHSLAGGDQTGSTWHQSPVECWSFSLSLGIWYSQSELVDHLCRIRACKRNSGVCHQNIITCTWDPDLR